MLKWKSKYGNNVISKFLPKQIVKVFNKMTVGIDDSQGLCKV